MGKPSCKRNTDISFNMNIGMLLCFVLTVGLGVSSMSNINKEKNIGAKIERFRRSPGITCSGCLEPTSTSAIVAILRRRAARDCKCNNDPDACQFKRRGYYFCSLRRDSYKGCRHKQYDIRARAYYSLSACYDNFYCVSNMQLNKDTWNHE